ncbi:MAG: hypothetical protein HY525_17175 [Betaproteobacteria bacterium]|nr:hypothetical protein [Betaproteobacteria bacterium]
MAMIFCSIVNPPSLNQNPLNLIKGELIVAPVIEAGGAGALVVCHLLRDFKLAAVAQVCPSPRREVTLTITWFPTRQL